MILVVCVAVLNNSLFVNRADLSRKNVGKGECGFRFVLVSLWLCFVQNGAHFIPVVHMCLSPIVKYTEPA